MMKHIYYAFLFLPHLSGFFGLLLFIGVLGVYSFVCGNGILRFTGHYIVLGYLQEFINFSFVRITTFPLLFMLIRFLRFIWT